MGYAFWEEEMFLQNLCAIQWTNYLVDGVLLLVLVGYVFYCAKRGFVDCFFGFFSTTIALIAAMLFAKVLVNITGGLFGLRGVLDRSFTKAFMKEKGFDTVLVGEATATTLKKSGTSAVVAQIALKLTKGAHKGTVLADALGNATASLATTIICAILIFIIAKLLMILLKNTLEGVAKNIKIVDATNTLLGAFVGFLGFTLLLSTILAIFAVLPIRPVKIALNNSLLVGFIYKYNPVVWIIGLFL